eukprot:gnl/Hemi2/8432_TR2914_c0_g1_i1.p1 gnl/Hemi2/8432_TR2914_c0_g1~~gnl/Hemi2/8432_TR2914_c0_g1_i1.p1  ORF type:complete len:410 (+),score=89.69 gnl/Hemi2/8432_TR2914_c0_g1_i1:94-1323(+)
MAGWGWRREPKPVVGLDDVRTWGEIAMSVKTEAPSAPAPMRSSTWDTGSRFGAGGRFAGPARSATFAAASASASTSHANTDGSDSEASDEEKKEKKKACKNKRTVVDRRAEESTGPRGQREVSISDEVSAKRSATETESSGTSEALPSAGPPATAATSGGSPAPMAVEGVGAVDDESAAPPPSSASADDEAAPAPPKDMDLDPTPSADTARGKRSRTSSLSPSRAAPAPVSFAVDADLNSRVSIWKGDITTLKIDAIVNAANGSLLGGGGVDGAIHDAAGRGLYLECRTLNGCNTGFTKITGGHDLPCKHVLHTVGPVGFKPALLQSCYTTCMDLVEMHGLRSVAFCCISTGIFGYPNEPACHTALRTVREWLETGDNRNKVDRIIFCLFMPVDVSIYKRLMFTYFPIE